MSRLIDADTLPISSGWIEQGNQQVHITFAYEYDIQNSPTVDAVPVVHARWILDEDPHDGDCRCSHCFIAIAQMDERNHGVLNALTGGKWWTYYKYCPQCGAKMDEPMQPNDSNTLDALGEKVTE